MRKLTFTALFAALVLTSSCDLANPEKVRAGMIEALHPYFPNAQVLVLNDLAIGLSCLDSAGPKLAETVRDVLPNLDGTKQLRQARKFGVSRYRYLGIGFPNSIVRYDFDTDQLILIDDPGADYRKGYEQLCGLRGSDALAFAYMGYWDVEYTDAAGAVRTGKMVDTLGSYQSEVEFSGHKAAEIESRETLIRASIREQGGKVTGMRITEIKRIPLTRTDLGL